jgi:hypothetical protein
MEELNDLNSLNALRDSYAFLPPIRVPPRLRKRQNYILSFKPVLNDKQRIMEWKQNHWKKKKRFISRIEIFIKLFK